ncbi:uncharacterized protein LOC128554790 isoform X2 [Mercenaria mercenaria]|uniref:uncharacterized protein LOC128554790 isoform X2 n=1 Tax=Mercenaria mercenaria TaxID=6596 RepID=UPI00234F7340|nr:uncharacterized protein LOC128554790 isoform X2 [Mercenaria mercenaria]
MKATSTITNHYCVIQDEIPPEPLAMPSSKPEQMSQSGSKSYDKMKVGMACNGQWVGKSDVNEAIILASGTEKEMRFRSQDTDSPILTTESQSTQPRKRIRTEQAKSEYSTRMEDEPKLLSVRLLSKEELNVLWHKSSEEIEEKVLAECEKICAFIKTKSKSILCVYPVYDIKDDTKVQFLVLTEKKIRCPRNIKYDVVMRKVNDCSGESMAIQRNKKITKDKYSLTPEERKHMRDVINRNAPDLMKRYKYVSVISGSGIRSKGYDTKNHMIIPQPCIVIYVHTKNKIPLSEGKLPQTIENIPVDVREGSFQNSSSDRYDKLLMGCQITSSVNSKSSGTLGGFIDHPLYGLCGVTCAHVVLSKHELHDSRKKGSRKWEDSNHKVYQPAVVQHENYVGALRETFYKTGGDSKPGVDLAVFQIQNRPPDSGKFPEEAGMLYETGRIEREIKPYQYGQSVVKFGQTTSKTDGFVQFNGAAVKKIDFNEKYCVNDVEFTYTLFDQIEIQPPPDKDLFSDGGDSGALVFIRNADEELACIGMVIGNLNVASEGGSTSIRRGNSIVTPISTIQDELGVSEFKSFVWYRIENMEKRFTSIDMRLGKLDKMDERIENMEGMITKIAESKD